MATVQESSIIRAVSHPEPLVSMIIPSLDGYRQGNVPKLVEQVRAAHFESCELILVEGVRPNGKARDEGVRNAKGKFYIFLDDDVTLGSKNIVEALIRPFLQDREGKIGLTGASYLLPPDAGAFQKKVAAQIPRVECPVVSKPTESDMVCHACLAVSAEVYRKAGGENRELASGTDPDFKERIRRQGYRVLLVPNAWVYMPTYKNFSDLCRKAWSAGKNSALTQALFPHRVHFSAENLQERPSAFPGLPGRIYSSLRKIFAALLKGHWLYIANRSGYALGYLAGRFQTEKKS